MEHRFQVQLEEDRDGGRSKGQNWTKKWSGLRSTSQKDVSQTKSKQ